MPKFGSNQIIASGVIGAATIASALFVQLGKLNGDQWLKFCDGFLVYALGAVLLGSAAIKVTQAIKGAVEPPTP